jgi:NAD(P)-dependent dehydrogenase (short-subunit alcohol dehydrogenase family)
MKDKIILITGSTDGIGKQTAIDLAEMGSVIIIHGRDQDKTRNTADEIKGLTGNGNIHYLTSDLSSLKQVKLLSEEIHVKFQKINVLINNAGVYEHRKVASHDGHEMTFAVNHLGHFYLTHLLKDLIPVNNDSRIINVSSMAHAGSIDFENLQGEKYYDGYNAYSLSKLCNILFTYEAARRFQPKGITVNCLHPGVIRTKLLRAGWGLGGAPVQSGSKASVYLATSSELKGVTGKYFSNSRPVHSSGVSYDSCIQQQLWEISKGLCGI